jgi:hypothetical protein
VRDVANRRQHAESLINQIEAARQASAEAAVELPAEVQPDGMILAFEAWPGFDLALESLDLRGSGVELIAVQPSLDDPPRAEIATVFVPYDATGQFVRRLEEFADPAKDSPRGAPHNAKLVANIARIRVAVLQGLWTDSAPFPEQRGRIWWEVWLRRTPDTVATLDQVADALGWDKASQIILFPDRIVTAVAADAASLAKALSSRLQLAEIRSPRVARSPTELAPRDQRAFVSDLATRITACPQEGPAVCLLDTGGYRHSLLAASLAATDLHYAVGTDPFDHRGHGTKMAGLALYSDLTDALSSTDQVAFEHCLESVKIYPDPHAPDTDPDEYGYVTASAASMAEDANPERKRVFCMAVSADGDSDGRPTLWSATVDALAFGTDVKRVDRGIELLSDPAPEKGRLFVVSAGNVDPGRFAREYLTVCDDSEIEDPGQAWNAITVGGYTALTAVPADDDFVGYSALAPAGALSPFSRTSVPFDDTWPIKPEVVLEAGNLLASRRDPPTMTEHEVVSLLTTSLEEREGRSPLGTISMTSAATAQAARLAAVAAARYPTLWPETIRGLLVHSAQWTDPMWAEVEGAPGKTERAELLRRFGYGVPTEERVLRSATNAVTLIAEDWIQPYERHDGRTRASGLRLHSLPWPRRELLALAETEIALRVTLSYFIEPNPSSRTWKKRYAYRSHGLQFGVRQAGESDDQFRRRMSREQQATDADAETETDDTVEEKWFIGKRARNRGSIHSDVYRTIASDLADSGAIGVFPVGGWWKDGTRRDRADRSVRYSLLVSLITPRQDVDLYTPIAIQIGVPIEIEIETQTD